jgi:hypothetical protein
MVKQLRRKAKSLFSTDSKALQAPSDDMAMAVRMRLPLSSWLTHFVARCARSQAASASADGLLKMCEAARERVRRLQQRGQVSSWLPWLVESPHEPEPVCVIVIAGATVLRS